ncbi:hypothetical protein Tco_0989227 [Tanacetum coccineum]|uniref:Uncharacterized protein n=1 Tax=Tanacetum coccineum TaxID=301880 RepID=A0ABQ5ETL3_9ASTR
MLQQFFLDHEGTSIYQIPPEVQDGIMLRVRVAVQEFRGALTGEQFVQKFNIRGFQQSVDAFDLLCSNGSYFHFSRTRFRPRSCILEEWIFIKQATLLAGNQHLGTQNPRSMILHYAPPWHYVSLLNDLLTPVYRQGEDVPQVPFNYGKHVPANVVSPILRWESSNVAHYSTGPRGGFATIIKSTLLYGQHCDIIRDIQLFKITPD